MKRLAAHLATALVLASPLAAQQQRASDVDQFHWRQQLEPGMTPSVHTVNGAVDVAAASGSEAEVTGERMGRDRDRIVFDGRVSASSGNGSIVASMSRLSSNAPMEFSTGNGSVRVTVPSDFQGAVEANTGNGSFSTDFPITVQGRFRPNHVHGTIGSGDTRVQLSTGNGSLELRKGS